MYYVYLVRCNDGSLYCGQTKNITQRLYDHNTSNSKSAKYTKGRRPITLAYVIKIKTLSQALKKEYEIKKLSKQKKELLVSKCKQVNKVISSK